MYTMITTAELKTTLVFWKNLPKHPMAKAYIKAIKAELKLRKQ